MELLILDLTLLQEQDKKSGTWVGLNLIFGFFFSFCNLEFLDFFCNMELHGVLNLEFHGSWIIPLQQRRKFNEKKKLSLPSVTMEQKENELG